MTRSAVVHGARELFVGPTAPGEGGPIGSTDRSEEHAARGTAVGADGIDEAAMTIEDGAIAIEDGRIAAVGPSAEITREYPPENADTAVNATGQAVVPGFVDSHTHALFAGDRSEEFAAKLRGTTYRELLEAGGGIHRTVRAVRGASDERLLDTLLGHLDVMLAHGTTTVEVKSGYGLDTETELRMLDAIARADEAHPVDVIGTFMGAHAVPADRGPDEYVGDVIDDQLPAVERQGVAEFCDVFCEEGVFTVDQSRRVLEAGARHGLTPKVHAEELSRQGGAQLAADLGAASADHLLWATREDAAALAAAGVTPVLLPGTAFSLGSEYADPATFREEGATVAVASDFNPNCYSQSMGMATALACVEMEMPPAEAVAAATRGGALALNRGEGTGTLRPGGPADLSILDGPSHVHIPYNFGVNTVETVLKGGVVVHDRTGQRTPDRTGNDGLEGRP